MGPYCEFCGARCYVYIPTGAPQAAIDAYGTVTMVASCAEGQEFEKQKIGWCWNDIQIAMADRTKCDAELHAHLQKCPRCSSNDICDRGDALTKVAKELV